MPCAVNKQAQELFTTLRTHITSRHVLKSFDTAMAGFLKADGNPRPEQAVAKSGAALSRMYNCYDFPVLTFIRTLRQAIEKYIWTYFSASKKRRPVLELILDMTTLLAHKTAPVGLFALEKTGEFEGLPLSYFNEKYGLHVVVLYIVIGRERFPWAWRFWRGQGETTWVEHALSLLRCLPAFFKERFRPRVLADTGFGSSQMIEGCHALGLPLVVGIACDRKTEQGFRADQLGVQAGVVMLKGCKVPVWATRYKLHGKRGYFEWRCVVSTTPASSRTIIGWGKRRWRIEAFFKTMKSRFGLDQFGQRTLSGVIRFLLFGFLAYILTFWTTILEPDELPDWQALARTAREWLTTWVVRFELEAALASLTETERLMALQIA
jgi:hypothetical protein